MRGVEKSYLIPSGNTSHLLHRVQKQIFLYTEIKVWRELLGLSRFPLPLPTPSSLRFAQGTSEVFLLLFKKSVHTLQISNTENISPRIKLSVCGVVTWKC